MSKPQSQVAAAVDALFRRWPALVGFSVQETPAAEIVVLDVETDQWPAYARELWNEVTAAVVDLIDEEPAAREFLAGRTFARTLH